MKRKKVKKSGKMKHTLKSVMFEINLDLKACDSFETSVTGNTTSMSILKALEAMEILDVSGLNNCTVVKVRPI